MTEAEKITLPTPIPPSKKYFAELIGTMVCAYGLRKRCYCGLIILLEEL